MSLDKFGRYYDGGRVVKGPKGDGFSLTPTGDYDISRKRLRNVQDPEEDYDAINYRTFKAKTLKLDDNIFDAEGRKITNVGTPEEDAEVANKKYVDSSLPIKLKESYSFGQYRVQDVAYPQNKGDVATKDYVDAMTPSKHEHYWDFGHKRLSKIANPHYSGEAVNLNTLRLMTLNFDTPDGHLNAQGRRIENLGHPVGIDDAVSKRYFQTMLADLGYALYKKLRRGRAPPLTAKEWKSKVFETPWEELL